MRLEDLTPSSPEEQALCDEVDCMLAIARLLRPFDKVARLRILHGVENQAVRPVKGAQDA